MADPNRNLDTGGDTGMEPSRESTGLPRWVWIVGIIVIVVALLVAVLILSGGHGIGPPPGGH